jgi:hypothetical protein
VWKISTNLLQATVVRRTAFAAAILASVLSVGAQPAKTGYCAPRPPPQGLVSRCQSRVFIIPANLTALRFALSGWMNTCVSADRGVALVYEAESVDEIWDLVKDLPTHSRTIKITPKYEPVKFTQNGKTCYGVKSVEFAIRRGSVDSDGPIEVQYGPTDEMIKSAAAAAKRALASPFVKGSPELSRFLGVLDGLERYGEDFDDTYYPVAPQVGGLDAYACYKEYTVSTGNYSCLPPDEAKKACARHLADDLVTAHYYDKVSASRLAEILEIKANDINRGVMYLLSIQDAGTGLLTCPGLKNVIKPAIGALANGGQTTVYGYY